MELKISKIQWKKVIAFMLTLCMVITMVQVPVNAEETGTQEPTVSRHLNMRSLRKYKKKATFFDATLNPDVTVTTMQAGTSYTVDPTVGRYDAKWFAFTADTDGIYIFEGQNIGEGYVDSYGSLFKRVDGSYKFKENNDDGASHGQFKITTFLKAGATYYLCAGYYNESYAQQGEASKYSVSVRKPAIETLNYTTRSQSFKPATESDYKFTAKATGYHIIHYAWDKQNTYIRNAYPTIKDEFGSDEYANYLSQNGTNYYQYFYAVKGETYYIYRPQITFRDNTTKKDVEDVNTTIGIAYYDGKASMSAIKTKTPWIPDDEKPQPATPAEPAKPATIKVSKIKIAATSNKIAAGKKVKLTATVTPANASNKAVKWTTSNKKVAVVSKSGVVTVNKKAGGKTVVITAIAADGKGARATYKITVMKDAVKKVTITGKNVVKAGKKLTLKAKVAAGKKANKKLVWSTSNKKFATVNQKGVVTATKAGKGKKVKITAKATDGSNKKKTFVITIK